MGMPRILMLTIVEASAILTNIPGTDQRYLGLEDALTRIDQVQTILLEFIYEFGCSSYDIIGHAEGNERKRIRTRRYIDLAASVVRSVAR